MRATYQPTSDYLKDQIILVTGAGRGIGKAAAQAFAAAGATVILLGKNVRDLTQTYDMIVSAGYPKPAIVPFDFRYAKPEDYQQLKESIEKNFGHLNGLLHNAATVGTLTPLSHYDPAQWFEVLHVNLNAPFVLTQTLLPLMNKAKHATILFTLDPLARRSRAYWGAYAVSKAGLKALMETLASELADNTAIRVNGIVPETVNTRLRRLAYPLADSHSWHSPENFMHDYVYLMGEGGRNLHGEWLPITPRQTVLTEQPVNN